MKRSISVFLALLLLFTGISVTNNAVYAQDEETKETAETIEAVEEERDEETAVVEETAEDQTVPDETAEVFEEEQETVDDEELLPVEEDLKAEEEPAEIQAEPSTTGDAYAILTGEGELVFFRSSDVLTAGDKTLTIHEKTYSGYVYTGVENTGYDVPWATRKSDIVKAYALDVIRPVKMRSWFSSAVNFVSFDTTNIDASAVTDMGFMFLWCTSLQELDLSSLDTSAVTNMSNLFSDCTGLKELELGNGFIKASVTSLDNMFGNCSSLESIDLSGSDTSGATKMRTMFSGCSALKSIDLSSFDTANVTDMIAMFSGCSSLKELDLSSFDTEGVIGIHSMFYGCTSLERLDLSSFDLRSIGDDTLDNGMKSMFTNCRMLSSVKLGTSWSQWKHDAKLPAGSWKHATVGIKTETELYDGYVANRDTWAGEWVREHQAYAVLEDDGDLIFTRSFEDHETGEGTLTDRNGDTYTGKIYANVETATSVPWNDDKADIINVYAVDTISPSTMQNWFANCGNLESFDGDNFDTANVTSMRWLFRNCIIMTSADLETFDTSRVTSMYEMFVNCKELAALDVSGFDTSNVTDMYYMFGNCNKLESLDVSHFDTANVTKMEGLFFGCNKVASLDVSYFDTSKVTAMSYMFCGCKQLTSLDVSGFDTANVATMMNMFADCNELTSLDVSHFDTSKVTEMNYMFYGCKELTSLDLSHFNTANVTNMFYMFRTCSNLESLDVSSFNTEKVTNMGGMFQNCKSLTSLDVSSFNTSNVTNMDTMFSGLESITAIDVSNFDTSKVTMMGWMFSHNFKLESITFSEKFKTASVTEMPLIFGFDEKLKSLDLSSFDLTSATQINGIFDGCNAIASVKLGSGWTKWNNDSLLPSGTWSNETLGLRLTETQLQEQYPAHAAQWAGLWEMTDSYAVLTDEGELIFMNAVAGYANGSIGDLKDPEGNIISGRIFADVDAKNNSGDNVRWYAYKNQIKKVYAVDSITPMTMDSWFMNCVNLESFDGTGYDTSQVSQMDYLFSGCTNMTSVDVSGFDTSRVVYMDYMFTNCRKLTELDLSNFDTANVGYFYCMFMDCRKLVSLDISSFDNRNAGTNHDMFVSCLDLRTVKLGRNWKIWDSSNVLPSGTWTNGVEYLSAYDLMLQYPGNADDWAGTWIRTDTDAYGQILPLDRPSAVEDIPGGLWIAGVKDEPYTGKAITQDFRVYDHKTLLTAGKDYTFKYANNTKAGTASVTITGKGNYQGTLKKEFTILPLELNETNTVVTLNKDTFAYNGKVQKPKVTSVVYNGKKLKANTDYTVKYWTPESKEAPYEYNIEIIGKGNYYSENFYAKYVITDLIPVNTLTVSGLKDQPYTGTAINAYDLPLVIKRGKEVIYDKVNGINEGHVSLYVENGTDVGTASLIIQGSTGYAGRIVKTFKITGTALSKAKITGIDPSYEFTGSEWTPIAVLTVNGTDLTGKEVHEYADLPDSEKRTYDYTYEYKDNLDIGTAAILFEGVNGYTGSLKKTFKITGTTLTAKNVTADGLGPYDYKGEAIEPKEPQVQLKYGGANLFEGFDYEIVSYKNNDKAGTATVTYKGIGKYTGTFNKTFKINKAKLDGAVVKLVSSYGYTKGGAKPEPEVTVDGHKLVSGKDYTLTYKNNTKPGTAALTIKGKGNYEGTLTRTFEVTKRRLTSANMTVNDKVYAGKAVAMSTAVTITDVNGKKLKAGTDYDKTIRYTSADDTVVYDTSVNPSQPVTRRAGSEVLKTDFIDPLTRIKAEATLKGNYTGTISKIFRIVYFDVAKAKVTISQQYYKGTQIYPKKQDLVIMADGFRLTDDDYEIVSCENNLTAGKASITIMGVGRCGGTKTISFTIAKRSLGMTIKFHPNGATSGNVKDLLIYKDTKLNKNSYKKVVAVGTEIKTYRFNGWNTRYDGLGTHYDERAVYTYEPEKAGSFVILYAEWIEE